MKKRRPLLCSVHFSIQVFALTYLGRSILVWRLAIFNALIKALIGILMADDSRGQSDWARIRYIMWIDTAEYDVTALSASIACGAIKVIQKGTVYSDEVRRGCT